MALFQAGTFTSNAGPQDIALSFGGETPKAVLIWHAGATAAGIAAGAKIGFGAAVSASSRAAVAATSEDAQATSDTDRRHTNVKVLTVLDYAQTVIEEGDIALAANKFTITYSTSLTGLLYNFLAFGGDIEVDLKQIQTPASTGEVAYTGVGLEADCLIGLSATISAVPTTISESHLNIGLYDGTANTITSIYSKNEEPTSITRRHQSSTGFLGYSGTSKLQNAFGVSIDSDGYTLNWDVTNGYAAYHWILAIKGISTKVIVGDQPATNTTVNRACGFPPKAAMCLTHMGRGSGFRDDVPSVLTGKSHKFDGENDYVDLGVDAVGPSLHGSSAVSLSLWVKAVALAAGSFDNVLFNANVHAGLAALWLNVRGDGANAGKIIAGGRSILGDSFQSATSTVSASGWTHVCAIWDFTNDEIRISVNGSALEVNSVTFTSDTYDHGTPTLTDRITSGALATYHLRGSIKDVRIYDDALTAGEVTTLHGGGDVSGNLVSRWKLDGDYLDSTAGSNHGTFIGAVNNHARLGIGAWDSANNMAFAGAVDENAQGTTDADRVQRSTLALQHIDHNQTVTGSATFAASGNDIVETWTGVDGTQREHAILAFGDPPAPPIIPNSATKMMISA